MYLFGLAFIYALCDPDTGIEKYVGMSVEPLKRFASHICSREKKSPKSSWIKNLMSKQKQPLLKIIEVCSVERAPERERHWIRKFTEAGRALKNLTEGGTGGTTHRGRPRAIACSNGRIYPSIKAAADELDIHDSTISLVVSGKGRLAGGHQFWDAHKSKPDLRPRRYGPARKPLMPKMPSRLSGREVICIDTGEIFPSGKAAANAKGIDYKQLNSNLLRKQPTVRGFRFEYTGKVNGNYKLRR